MIKSIDHRIEQIISQMTLDEKLAQIGSMWIYELQTKGQVDPEKIEDKLRSGIGQITRLGGASSFDPVTLAKTANLIQKHLINQTRLGIPAIIHEECCAGALLLGGTIFPQIIGLASTYQPEFAEKMATEIKRQLRAVGAHQGLAPVLDVARDPRWGRVEETFGEDPLLACQFGIRYIRGLQGDTLKNGILATGKHFIGHSFSLGGLNCAPVHIGTQNLWDIYLMPFQAAVRDANLGSMMNAYPELDGEVVAASRRILTDLLRTKLGFEGLVVSDYFSIGMIHNFHYNAEDKAEAAMLALKAGIDVECPTVECYGQPLKEAIEDGRLSLDYIDGAVRRHLQKKFELDLFDNPYVDEGRVLEVFETAPQRALAREIACQSMVLLSNDGTLPLKKTLKHLAVIGPNANDKRNLLGDYSYASMLDSMLYTKPENSSYVNLDPNELEPHQVSVTTVLEAIRAKLPDVDIHYAKGCDVHSADRSGFTEALQAANDSEIVILALGDKSGMSPDSTCGEFRDSADIQLPGVQNELAKVILDTGKPVIVVLINGRPLAIAHLVEEASAILEAWLPGEEGGQAIADVLLGDVNPGGKLPMTFPRTVGQIPIFYNHKPSGNNSYWYTDYVSESVQPLFHFGHGLSYTTFDYTDLSISPEKAGAGDIVDVTFNIRNSGSIPGDEIVQLYIRDVYASTPRPKKELKGFKRIRLEAGTSQTISFKLPVNLLAFYNADLNLVIEPGKIEIMIGSSSQDIRLQGSFEISGREKTIIQERIFECPVEIR